MRRRFATCRGMLRPWRFLKVRRFGTTPAAVNSVAVQMVQNVQASTSVPPPRRGGEPAPDSIRGGRRGIEPFGCAQGRLRVAVERLERFERTAKRRVWHGTY